MEADPCNVCGGTETELKDGYYYCIECGTQNTDVRETVLEEKALGDGTFAQSAKRKIIHLKKDGIEMSGEWYRWHAYNFMIAGLADDLVALGAKPTFKKKLLWIWTKYIKKYQNKTELMMNQTQDEYEQSALPSFMAVEEDSNPAEEDDAAKEEEIKRMKSKCYVTDSASNDITFFSKGLIIAMLYVALNLDESDIQLSHLYRFLQEKHLDVWNIKRFVPEDVNVKKIPQWLNFIRSKPTNQHQVRALAMALLRKLDLGTPKAPDLRKIVHNFLTELCLPNDLKPLIYSLMHYHRCDYLDIDNRTKKILRRMPDYEGAAMSYILVAIKICFGLDSEYENKLSDVVDKINLDKQLPQSIKIGKYSEPSDRLFSFREWCNYLQFRKIMLSKHNLRIAEKNYLDVDDYVYLEHMEERPKNNEQLSDKIAMELINRLPQERNIGVIPKDMFIPTLTPLSDYADILIEYCQDLDIKQKLAEDFRRYSLKYVCENLCLLDSNMENVIKGVSDDNKTSCEKILGIIVTKKAKKEMVYVKNCENRNWLKTKPPTIEHVICTDEAENETNDKESDHGYDSEITSKEKDLENITNQSLNDPSVVEANTENNDSGSIKHGNSISQEHNFSKNVLKGVKPVSDTDRSINNQNQGQNNTEDENNAGIKPRQENSPERHNLENEFLESVRDERFSDSSSINKLANNNNDSQNDNNAADSDSIHNDNEIDNNIYLTETHEIVKNVNDKSSPNSEQTQHIIEEEDICKNIFDDCFEDLTLKEECEQNRIDDCEIHEDGNEGNIQIENNEVPDEDFDRRSDMSDPWYPTFNPETFDRSRTIKELILHACKKYKITVPSEYRTKEPRKRKVNMFNNDVPGNRTKRTKYEGRLNVQQLLSDYNTYMQSDFVSKVQQQMSLAVRNAELQNEMAHENNLSCSNLQISVVERNGSDNRVDSPIAHSDAENTIEPVNDLDTTHRTDINNDTGHIDENLEDTLFDDDEKMQLDDLIPKGDPNFDENIYDTNQLYMKIKEEPEDGGMVFVVKDDPEIDQILLRKIEQCKNSTEFANLKPKPKYPIVENGSDSEDEIPLNIIKDELKVIEERFRQEDKYERLIKMEIKSEYKYWIRHYDRDFLLRSKDKHTKFDEELKENTPTSFYFVLQECASILNCSKFHLYKNMQNLEEYLVAKAKHPSSNVEDTNFNLSNDDEIE